MLFCSVKFRGSDFEDRMLVNQGIPIMGWQELQGSLRLLYNQIYSQVPGDTLYFAMNELDTMILKIFHGKI